MTEAMPFLQKTILLSYDPRPLRAAVLFCCGGEGSFYWETGAFVLGARRAAVEGGRRWPCGDAAAFCGEDAAA